MKAHATAWLCLISTAVLAASAPAETPENNYMLRCQGCHRPDGSGIPGAVPPFPGVIAGFLATPAGRGFIVRVPGVANAPLDDEEVAQLLGWILRRFDAPNLPSDFVDYTAAEVAALRRQPIARIADEREAVLSGLERGR